MNIEQIYRDEWGRVLASVIRLVGSFDLAEESVQEAFAAAVEQWPREGPPQNPRAWLISTARHKAIDHLRRARRVELQDAEDLARLAEAQPVHGAETTIDEGPMRDERLSLIFTCCHPALAQESQVALTLRTLCGLTTEEIARAFLVPLPTMAQRLVRTKQKIRAAQIPYRVPDKRDLPDRLDAVMLVIYLVFNEGYAASSGDSLVRRELCQEAIRLGRILCELLPEDPGPRALLALMLLHDSRRAARTGPGNELITLEEQDRSLWDQDEIREGMALAESALRAGNHEEYALQAAIASLHAQAATVSDTDWPQIARLYDLLWQTHPSPVVELNRAAAIAMAFGPQQGLCLLDDLQSRGELAGYYLLPAARADLLRRDGQWTEAAASYRAALNLVKSATEKQYLERRLREVEGRLSNG
ncbi:MAG: RNA polymerase sigma factor [Acidobacteriia bacterium]|nr:RNA polymerase sigma factor [Terriglobia bacterium]